MGEFSKWLLHEDRKELFDYLFAVALNAVFLALAALLLWPAGRAATVFTLAKGFWGFWTVLIVTAALLGVAHRIFRVDLDSHADAYVITCLFVGGVAQAGWSAFAALFARDRAAGASIGAAVALYLVGLLSCWVAFNVVSAFYGGSVYRRVNIVLAAFSFVFFCVWPAAARVLYGWFFDFYGRFLNPYGWFSSS